MGKAFDRTKFIPSSQHPWATPKSDAYYAKLRKRNNLDSAAKGYKRTYKDTRP